MTTCIAAAIEEDGVSGGEDVAVLLDGTITTSTRVDTVKSGLIHAEVREVILGRLKKPHKKSENTTA